MDYLNNQLLSTIFPDDILLCFELSSIEEYEKSIELCFQEKKELIPKELKGVSNVILDGFCNPLELLNYPLKGKPTYLRIYRRRWRQSGTHKHYHNIYKLHPKGIKVTHDFASFLKGVYRYF
ncbi:MAG: hypothetical protein LUH15_01695 [Tannerellaceae bacterium]|nr:hypothetical protein [Tannerellaceae bacterium]